MLWILLYLFVCALGQEDVLPSPAWLALTPVAILVMHMIYPTAMGWLIIIIPTLLYAGIEVYFFVDDIMDQETYNLEIIFLGALLCTCAGLLVGGPWKGKRDFTA